MHPGGTATGNGLNAPDGVAEFAIAEIARSTGLPILNLLGRAAGDFGSRCVLGIEADRQRCRAYALASPAVAAALNPLVGYDAATRLARQAAGEHRSLREVVRYSALLDPAQLESTLDVDMVARGGSPANDEG